MSTLDAGYNEIGVMESTNLSEVGFPYGPTGNTANESGIGITTVNKANTPVWPKYIIGTEIVIGNLIFLTNGEGNVSIRTAEDRVTDYITINPGDSTQDGGQGGNVNITAGYGTVGDSFGGEVNINAGASSGTASGGNATFSAGAGGGSGSGGDVQVLGGNAGNTSGTPNGGNVFLIAGASSLGANGHVIIRDPLTGYSAIFETSSLSDDRTYTFPNASGTFALVSGGGSTITSGTYTPTASSATNLDSTPTMTQAQYMRVGDTVTISGRFTANPTTTATPTDFEITLPIASDLGSAEDAAGVAFSGAIAGMGAEVIGVAANNTAQIQWVASDVNSQTWSYTFTYQVI